jgi:hypothetical protein
MSVLTYDRSVRARRLAEIDRERAAQRDAAGELPSRHSAYVKWNRWAIRTKDQRTYREACADLGYPTDRELVFDADGNPFPFGWDGVQGVDNAADPFKAADGPDGVYAIGNADSGEYGPEHDEAIPYALPAGPQEVWSGAGPPRDEEFYSGREDEIRQFIRAGISPEACGLVRLSAAELRQLWRSVAELAERR